MSICVDSIGEVTITLKNEGEVNVGDLVVMSKNKTAKKAVSDEDPIGVCVSKNGEYIAVMISGGATLNCDGGELTAGFHAIKVQEDNKITKAQTGKVRLIIDVDAVSKTAQVIL